MSSLMSLDFCCDVPMVGSEKGWCNDVLAIFFANFVPLSTN